MSLGPAPRRGNRFQPSEPQRGFKDVLKWRRISKPSPWPRGVANASHPPPPQRVDGGGMALTWIGQSTFLVQAAGLNIITDPFFSERAGLFGWIGPQRARPPAVPLTGLPPIDVVLVSHNHYDHMDKAALRVLAGHEAAHFIMPLGNARLLRGVVPRPRISELDWGHSLAAGAVKITAVPAAHWSRRSALDTNRALWSGFVVETGGHKVYFAGDTGFGDGAPFRAIRDFFGPVDVALLPIGAYEPRWFMAPQHMNPDDAVQAHKLLGSRLSLAMHHATIQLTDEPFDQPAKDLRAALAAHDVDSNAFRAPEAGETVSLGALPFTPL